jgi:uncharacterized protein (TIGR03083 family)
MLRTPEPILVVDRFPAERAALLELLGALDPASWDMETACPGWTVRDIVAHLVADDLGRLSRDRDAYSPDRRQPGEDVVAFVNRQNGEWVEAMRRVSPRLLRTLLEIGGRETQAHFEALDPFAVGGSVFWATGSDLAPVWLDLAREFTERWHHQQQIRDAVGAPPLMDPAICRPVLATFAYALPHTFRSVDAPPGTTITLDVSGESGGEWSTIREAGAWRLALGRPQSPAAEVEIHQDDFWRLVTKGMAPADAERRARIAGDRDLGRHVLTMVAIIG